MSSLRRRRRLEAGEETTGNSPTIDIDMTLVATPSQESPTNPNRTLKRKAEEEEPEALDPRQSKVHKPYTKHEKHWLLDGSVMLQMGNIRFKLHRSRLAAESPWFQALFDKRSGIVVEDCDDPDEIDPVLETVEIIDGCDLFNLDVLDDSCPEAAEFAELLTAMDNAIDYAEKKPEYPILVRIFKAACFFRFNRYELFAARRIQKLLPDMPSSISVTPIPFALEAINLGRTHKLPEILRRAFYELARLPPAGCADNGGALDVPANEGAVSLVKGLLPDDFNCVFTLQKHLSLSWRGIYSAASYACQPSANLPCKKHHSGSTIVFYLQKEQILDPIRALNELIARDWLLDDFCPAAADRVRRALTQVRKDMWQNMAGWLDIVFG